MCKHRRLHFGCDDCRSLVRFFDGEMGFQLHRLDMVHDRLQKLAEHGKVGNKTAEILFECLDEIEVIVKGMADETKTNQTSRHQLNVDTILVGVHDGGNNNLELGKRKR